MTSYFDDASGAFVERVMSARWEALRALTSLAIEIRPGEPFARRDQHPLRALDLRARRQASAARVETWSTLRQSMAGPSAPR